MPRYFLEVAYKGTRYSGFQIQENAGTIQSEVEKALKTLLRKSVDLTGSSRTDAGVHALQNYFHFDFDEGLHPNTIYKMNAILSQDIVAKNIFPMPADAHSRFDATSREYAYRIHRFKNPFLNDISHYYPYKIDFEIISAGADYLIAQQNFFPFSKTNTQVKNFNCVILKSEWWRNGDELVYTIQANRFLRGMVRLVTATLLKLGRGKISFQEFQNLFTENRKCGYSVPSHGLCLNSVTYPPGYLLPVAAPSQNFKP